MADSAHTSCSQYVEAILAMRSQCVLPTMSRERNEFKKFKESIILPAHPWGLSVLKPADENLPFMLILQICLLQPGPLNVFF